MTHSTTSKLKGYAFLVLRDVLKPLLVASFDPYRSFQVRGETAACFIDSKVKFREVNYWATVTQDSRLLARCSLCPIPLLPFGLPETPDAPRSCHSPPALLPVTVAARMPAASMWPPSILALSLICTVTTRSAMTASKPITVVYSSRGYTKRPGRVGPGVTGRPSTARSAHRRGGHGSPRSPFACAIASTAT